jgi:L-aspartate oxidase
VGPNKCYGAFVLKTKSGVIETVLSKITVIATGGIGQLFEHTTNSETATGDGIAMAYRAKAKIKNIEFIQFHPTALYQAETGTNFLISEAVRGFGAVLRTRTGEPFMQKYDVRKDLATRDIVARAIDTEIKHQKLPFVFLDCRHIPKEEFVRHFPSITTKCLNLGIDPTKKMIPVAPSAHYCCGGIQTDHFGNTNVENLYACGECACTGLHGANRLASNSLLEAIVFAHRCYLDCCKNVSQITWPSDIKDLKIRFKKDMDKKLLKDMMVTIRKTMSESLGIITTFSALEKGIHVLRGLIMGDGQSIDGTLSPDILQVRNMLTASLLILNSSKKRRKNEGVFYNSDLKS